jgi:hypothetical protein
MLTIVWNPRGFHLIKVLEKGRKFNIGHYIAEILEPISALNNAEVAVQKWTWKFHPMIHDYLHKMPPKNRGDKSRWSNGQKGKEMVFVILFCNVPHSTGTRLSEIP